MSDVAFRLTADGPFYPLGPISQATVAKIQQLGSLPRPVDERVGLQAIALTVEILGDILPTAPRAEIDALTGKQLQAALQGLIDHFKGLN